MTYNDIYSIIGIICGLGLFLYALKLMAGGLQRAAGEKMKRLLDSLGDNKFKGIFAGFLLTLIIQNSAETIVMVVGYVNAGIMSLIQAVSVIMGANIGTAMTSWLVGIASVRMGSGFHGLSVQAMILIVAGAIIYLYTGKKRKQNTGEIFLALGLMFAALEVISTSVQPFTGSAVFVDFLHMLGKYPFAGVLAGLVLAALLRSSTATVALLQMTAVYAVVPLNATVFICLGAGLGVAFTTLIASWGASRVARQAVTINMVYNTFGVLFWGAVFYLVISLMDPLGDRALGVFGIALFYTGYKIINTLFFAPMYQGLITFTDRILGDTPGETVTENEISTPDPHIILDERILNTPSLAIQAMSNSIVKLGKLCNENLTKGLHAVIEKEYDLIDEICFMENMIDETVAELTSFLVKLSNDGLTDRQSLYIKNFMYTVIDLERIGDHAENLAEIAKFLKEHNLYFSPMAVSDLKEMQEAVLGSVTNAVEARESGNLECVRNTLRFEDQVDFMEEEIRDRHIARLARKECIPEAGIVFLDVLTNLERVSDHAVNIAGYVKDEA